MENTPDTHRKRLSNYQPRHAGVPMSGWGAMLFGVPFLGAGVAITLVGMKVIKVKASSVHAPYWVITLIGGVFGAAGLWVMFSGVRKILRASRHKRMVQRHVHEPWLADYKWDPRQARDTPIRKIIGTLIGAAFLGVFLAPFHWVGLTQKGMGRMFLVVAGIFDLVGLGMVGYAFYLSMRYLKYGTSKLLYDRFPFFLGETFEAHFVPGRGIHSFENMKFTLRCIEVRFETSGSGKNRSTQAVAYQVWADTMEAAGGGSLRAGSQVPVTFLLPAESRLSTSLAGNPPHYWELQVEAETPGVDYKSQFLVPVYEKQ